MAIEKEWVEDRALPETYDRNHPHYYCYVTSCSIEDLRSYAVHRQLSFTEEFTKEQLAELLRADDKRYKETGEAGCDCCPWGPIDEEDNNAHVGCEDCPTHYEIEE